MRIKALYRFAGIALLAVSTAACGAKPALISTQAPSQPSSNPPTATQLKQIQTATPAAGRCSNPFAPVKLGATWTYRNTGEAVSPSSFKTTITDVRPDGFTVNTRFEGGANADQKWACKPEGLVALSLGSGQGALGLSLQGIKADLVASNASGITLPAKVQPGMKWPYALDIAGSVSQGNLVADGKGSISTALKAIGIESVSVPAGTFEAMKIQSVSTADVAANFHGINIPLTSTINTTFWFAPGIGWVKAIESGELIGTSVNTITELQSYNIP